MAEAEISEVETVLVPKTVEGDVKVNLNLTCVIPCRLDKQYNGSCSLCGQADYVYGLHPLPLALCNKCLLKHGQVTAG